MAARLLKGNPASAVRRISTDNMVTLG